MIQKLFSIAYFPPIDYMLEMKNADCIFVEAHENYRKQTYRNRCTILTSNGLYDLIIPIVKRETKIIKQIRIDNSVAWQRNHWKSIESAYNNSPYFIFYRDFFEPFFQKKQTFLLDFNIALTVLLRTLFSITNTFSLTDQYVILPKNTEDYRTFFLPKNREKRTQTIEYKQVFSDRYFFEKNLSCIDYLFTTGRNFD